MTRFASAPTAIRELAGQDDGLGLVEVLVVVLIVGILAAVAIPSFLGQKSKAYDASAKELVHSATLAAETYATDHGSEYKWGVEPKGVEELRKYEPNVPACPSSGNACLLHAEEYESGKGFKVVVEAASTGDQFTLIRAANGTVTRECSSGVGRTDCSGSPTGSW
jgi:type IV pilus assembly protein PilA